MFDIPSKDLRVMRLTRLLDDPDLFVFIKKYFKDKANHETMRIEKIIKEPIQTDVQRDSLNLHISRKNIFLEIEWGLRESLIEYIRLDDSEFAGPDGAQYREVSMETIQ